jgi:hypothetical protein
LKGSLIDIIWKNRRQGVGAEARAQVVGRGEIALPEVQLAAGVAVILWLHCEVTR